MRRRFQAWGLALILVIGAALKLALRPAASPLLQTVLLPLSPSQNVALAVDGRTQRVFVASGESVDVLTLPLGRLLRVVRTRQAGDQNVATATTLAALAIDTQTERVFVVNYENDHLLTLDARSGNLLHTAMTDRGPFAIAVDEQDGRVFVATLQGQMIDAYDARTGAVLNVSLGVAAGGPMAIDSSTRHGFVPEAAGGVAMFDTVSDALLARRAGGVTALSSLAVDTHAQRVFAVGDGTLDVAAFDARTAAPLPSIPLTAPPSTIVVDERAGRAFASNAAPGTVSTLDTRSMSVLATLSTGPNPTTAIDEQRGRVAVVSNTRFGLLNAETGRWIGLCTGTLSPQAIGIDEQVGHILIVSGRQVRRQCDVWSCVPPVFRTWLPFLPPSRPRTSVRGPIMSILDEQRLAECRY